jgi:hypothetical protein
LSREYSKNLLERGNANTSGVHHVISIANKIFLGLYAQTLV